MEFPFCNRVPVKMKTKYVLIQLLFQETEAVLLRDATDYFMNYNLFFLGTILNHFQIVHKIKVMNPI